MQKIEEIIDYEFKDKSLLKMALTHSSYSRNSNEKLEFIGDVILSFIVGIYVFKKFSDGNEGFYTSLKAAYVNKNYLNSVGKKLGISRYIKYKGVKPTNLSNFIESIIGAIYLDGGLRKTEKFVKKFILNKDVGPLIDYKGELIKISREFYGKLPSYKVMEEGEAHRKKYKAVVKIEGLRKTGKGQGKSKKEAQIKAAKNLLKKIQG